MKSCCDFWKWLNLSFFINCDFSVVQSYWNVWLPSSAVLETWHYSLKIHVIFAVVAASSVCGKNIFLGRYYTVDISKHFCVYLCSIQAYSVWEIPQPLQSIDVSSKLTHLELEILSVARSLPRAGLLSGDKALLHIGVYWHDWLFSSY